MSDRSSNSRGGIGFIGLLALLLIALKLLGIIDWSWIWVLSPIWLSTGCCIIPAIVLIFGIAILKVWLDD